MLISVVIPSYNRANLVGQTIDSILNHEVDADIEIIIGDDCSTDNAREILLPTLLLLCLRPVPFQVIGLGGSPLSGSEGGRASGCYRKTRSMPVRILTWSRMRT